MALAHPPVTATSSERWEDRFAYMSVNVWGFFYFPVLQDFGDSWHGRRRGAFLFSRSFSLLHLKAPKAAQNNLFFFSNFFFFSYYSADKMTLISNKEIISQEGRELEISSVPFTSPSRAWSCLLYRGVKACSARFVCSSHFKF